MFQRGGRQSLSLSRIEKNFLSSSMLLNVRTLYVLEENFPRGNTALHFPDIEPFRGTLTVTNVSINHQRFHREVDGVV